MKKGFTLLELIIVVIILGILVAIAIPTFTGSTLRAESAEAYSVLGALRASQIRYYESQTTKQYDATSACTGLDVTMTPLKYHESLDCSNNANNLVELMNSGFYNMCIQRDGDVICEDILATTCVGLGLSAGACP